MPTRVFADADMLFSRTRRDWLFLIKIHSSGGMFTVSTSVDVIAEAVARYRDRNPLVPGGVTSRMSRLIGENVDELVEEFTVDQTFVGGDEGDAHVDAAAKACHADVLLTLDKGWHDLPAAVRDSLAYEVQHPDDFFCLADEAAPEVIRKVIAEQMAYWFKRDGEADLPGHLKASACPDFAGRVRKHLQAMDVQTICR